ncbi:MAG TPA: Gfo/Idh/MocA family oxidoreductase, partial [Hanamia sp.]|nr:Gfo/Idh/MocA family oxidoreductase [Hanamia sp.]
MKNKTRVLIVGLGSIGRRHARLLSGRTDVELHICDTVPENRSQTLGLLLNSPAGTYSVFSEAIKAKPDIAFICVPNHLHVPLGLQAIEEGVDVFVEKPISDSLDAARNLVDAAES